MASFPEDESTIQDYFAWYTPRPGDTVFDVGAHCGFSTYHFSKLVGAAGRVIAFQPDPINYGLLLRNIARHGLFNVTPVPAAMAGSNRQAAFSCEESLGSALVRYASHTNTGDIIMVETITLEDAFTKWGPPQFCKIDIEGSELEVISCARQFLRSNPCQFAIDTHHRVGRAFADQRIEKLFRESNSKRDLDERHEDNVGASSSFPSFE